jgi:hypothetical protein
VDDTQKPSALAAAYDPNCQSRLSRCPTCKQRRPQHKPDGWGQMMDWWDCWPCRTCDALVCNMPVFTSKTESCTCYVQHNATCHPEVYEPPHPPGEPSGTP